MSHVRDASVLGLVDVGCFAWSRSRGYEGVHDDGRTQVEPIGGLVLDAFDVVDQETAEVQRIFKVADTHRGHLRIRDLPESDVDRSTLEAAAPGQVAKVMRQLCAEIAMTDRRQMRTGLVRPEHITMTTWAHRLAGLLA